MSLEGSDEWTEEIRQSARAAVVFYRDLLSQGIPEDVARDFSKAYIQSRWAKQIVEDREKEQDW